MPLAKSHFVEALEKIHTEAQNRDLTIREIFDLLGDKGHLILILFFSVPFLQPVPLLGLSTPFGFLVIIISYYFFMQKPPWLPQRFSRLKVSKAILLATVKLIEKIWGYIETVLKPRWSILYNSPAFRLTNFLLVSISALLLALPIPVPFTNTVPTVAIVLNMIGQLEEDGLVIILSFFAFIFALVFFTGIGALGAGLILEVTKYYDRIAPFLGF